MRHQFRRTLAAGVCLIVVPLSGAFAGPPRHDLTGCPKRSAGSVEFRKDDWVKINAPAVSSGDRTIAAFAASPGLAEHLYVTNGRSVKITRDGGCTWSTIYPLNTGGGPPIEPEPRPTLTHLATSPARALWAAGYQTYGAVDRPRVYWSTNSLTPEPTFNAVDLGMPAVGRVVDLQVPVSADNNVAYSVIEEPSTENPTQTVRRLYTTHIEDDPEQAAYLELMWKNIPLPDELGGPIEGMATSPLSRNLWVWSGSTYAVTKNILADEVDWNVDEVDGDIVAIDVNSSAITTIISREEQSTNAFLADPSGKVTGEMRVPVHVTAIAHGSRPGIYVVTDGKRTWGYDVPQRKWADITPRGAPAVPAFGQLAFAPSSSGRVVLGVTPDALYRWDTYIGERFLPPPAPSGVGGTRYTLPTSDLTDVLLSPTSKVVTVKPGVPQDVPVELQVPPDPNKIDVFFLVDTTGSMDKAIARLKEEIGHIANTLRKTIGKGACFGFAEFKDNSPDAVAARKVYQRHLNVDCDRGMDEFTKGLEGLKQGGGGNDPAEAQTFALTQAITGQGNDTLFVAKGQQAGFRTDAFKVVVLMTDAWFRKDPSYPSMDSTVETLNREHVEVVGVQVLTNNDIERTRADLDALTTGTGTVAPDKGVDCDGDGKIGPGDLLPGDPLVCETDGIVEISPAIIGLLLGVQDFGTIAVQVEDPHDVVREPIKGSTAALVNMKRQSGFEFTLPLTCSKEQDGLDLPVGLLPTVRSKTVLDKARRDVLFGEITVQCRADVIDPPEPPRPPRPPEPPPEVPAKPRPPLAVAIQPPPQPPAQPISNINLNAGFSQQEEQQFQLATVAQGAQENEQEQEEVELAMSGLDPRRNDLVAGAAVLAGAAIMSAAAAAHRRRLQRSTRRAYVTRF